MVDYAEIDLGVRDLVRLLNAAGFETTDSGDGYSKFQCAKPMEDILDFPHVVIQTTRELLYREADALLALLQSWGISTVPEESEVFIEATYYPAIPDVAIIFLGGVKDSDLPDWVRV